MCSVFRVLHCVCSVFRVQKHCENVIYFLNVTDILHEFILKKLAIDTCPYGRLQIRGQPGLDKKDSQHKPYLYGVGKNYNEPAVLELTGHCLNTRST